jgi:hypothetical protein
LARGGEGDNTVVIPLPKNGLQKGAFACAVGANEGHQFAAVDVHIDIVEDAFTADGNGQVLHPKATGITAAASVEEKFHPKASLMVSMLCFIASK